MARKMKPDAKGKTRTSKEEPSFSMTEAEALRQSELRYRRLFESAKDGILILDAETGEVNDVNPFLIELLGYSHELVSGKVNLGTGVLQEYLRQQGQL